MSDISGSFEHLTGGKTKPWMWGAALGLAVLVYLYSKHNKAGTVAAAAPVDPTAGANTSGGADSALGTPSAGTSTTYNNTYVTETVPAGSSTPGKKRKPTAHELHLQTLHNEHVKHEETLARRARAHAQVMVSHPSTHPPRPAVAVGGTHKNS